MTLLLTATLFFSGLFSLSSSVPRQFYVVKKLMNRTEAQQYCREKFIDLATIDNMTEMESLKRLMHEARVEEAWIGLKKGSSPKWQWSLADNEFYKENEREFRNWYQNEPATGKNCVSMTGAGGLWRAFLCNLVTGTICYDAPEKVKQIVRVNFAVDSAVNISDPVVQKAILEQVRQTLRKSNMSEDAKLTWKRQPDGEIFHKERRKKMKSDEL